MRYRNLDLTVLGERAFHISARSEIAGEADAPLDIDPADPNLETLFGRLARRDTDAGFLQNLGRDLFETLLPGTLRHLYERSYGETSAHKGIGLRLRLHIKPPAFAAWPWELIADRTDFLATSTATPVVRYVDIDQPIAELYTRLPARMLAVVPEISEPELALDVDREIDILRQSLAGLDKSLSLEVLRGTVTMAHFDEALEEHQPHVVHFIGHGSFAGDTGMMLLNDATGAMAAVAEVEFARLFKNRPSIKLVTLNACQGAQVSGRLAFAGVAPRLIEKAEVPAVVAMQFSVLDTAAISFARAFYGALFKGRNPGRVDWAMSRARNVLARELPDQREMAAPVLFMRARHGVIFDLLRSVETHASRDMLDTERAVQNAYAENAELAPDDTSDSERNRAAALVRRIGLRNRLIVPTAMVVLAAFALLWVKLFDAVGIDTMLKFHTIALGDLLRPERTMDDSIRIISLGTSGAACEPQTGGPWRRVLAELTNRLSAAGARAIVFDIAFSAENDGCASDAPAPTEALAAAIANAHGAGTAVIAGVKRLSDGAPQIASRLVPLLATDASGTAALSLAHMCLNSRLGYVNSVPLAVGDALPSLSLAAYMATEGFDGYGIGRDDGPRIDLYAAREDRTIALSDIGTVTGRGCPPLAVGDSYGELYIDLVPGEHLAAATLDYRAILDGNGADAVRDKVLFVGDFLDTDLHNPLPGGGDHYGVQLHAEAFQTLGRAAAGAPVAGPLGYGMQFLVLLGLGLAMIYFRIFTINVARAWRRTGLVIFMGTYALGALILYAKFGLVLDLTYHLVTIAAAYGAGGSLERRWLAPQT